MEPEANRLMGIEHMHFENDIRQENLRLKIRIRDLESKMRRILSIVQESIYLRPEITRWQ
jgi:hypothetical protein